MQYLWGILGVFVILTIAYLLSKDRKAINPRTILFALLIQVSFGFIVLKWNFGRKVFLAVTDVIQKIIDTSGEGIDFLFGGILNVEGVGVVFAFNVLTVIIFFSSLIAVLFHLGIMQMLTNFVGGLLSKLLKTSKPESLSAAANIFMGITEAPLVVKPFLKKMTNSELFAVMTGGTASVAGSVLIGYSLLGVPLEYLLAAAFMAAPAGLLMAKIIIPETEEVSHEELETETEKEHINIVDAASSGAVTGLQLALNIGAILLAFISLIALVNLLLTWVTSAVGVGDITLQQIFGYILAPLAWVIGIPWEEAVMAGGFIGEKFVLNEFVAFSSFADSMDMLSDKAIIIISFALCGFANLGAMAMMIGGIGSLAPNKKTQISRFGFLAVVGGTLANLLSAAIAGMLL